MAEIVADRLLGGAATYPGADTATKLKLSGVDVASFGDAFARTESSMEIVWADPVAGVYKKLVVTDDARRDVEAIYDHIAETASPAQADRIADRVLELAAKLA